MKYFLTSFDITGFEAIVDITEYAPEQWQKDELFKVLSGAKEVEVNPLNRIIGGMKLRARVNSQRHYEIYAFTADYSITEESLRDWADNDPQSLADWIRKNAGLCVHNDRKAQQVQVIR